MRKLILIAIAATALSVAIVLLYKGGLNWGPRAVTFADGTRLEFLGARLHGETFSTERPWERLLRRYLPNRWQGFLPPVTSGSCSSGSNSVTFYFRQPGTATSPHPWRNYAARDASGFLYPLEGGSCTMGGPTDQIVGLGLRVYPRRQTSFRLEFLGAEDATLASLTLPNPVRGPFPTWTASPLPVSFTNGPVVLTLESLSLHTNRIAWWLKPDWRLSTDHPQWRQAQAGYPVVEDATGNSGAYSALTETAWCVRTHVHRTQWEDFSTDERLVLTDLTLPAAAEFQLFEKRISLPSVEVIVHALCGAGTFSITNTPTSGPTYGMSPAKGAGSSMSSWGAGTTVESWSEVNPFLVLEISGMQDRDELRLRTIDSFGHEVSLECNGYHSRQASPTRPACRVYTPTLEAFTNRAIARLELLVSRPLDFEFFVNPADVHQVP